MTLTHLILCLLVTTSFADIIVNQLNGISDDNLVFSGRLPISDSSKSTLFFTYYGISGQKNQDNLKNSPLLIFVGKYFLFRYFSLGSSAQYINLGGMGPMKLNNDMTLSINPDSPNRYTNTMFIDLLGSGFSYTQNKD